MKKVDSKEVKMSRMYISNGYTIWKTQIIIVTAILVAITLLVIFFTRLCQITSIIYEPNSLDEVLHTIHLIFSYIFMMMIVIIVFRLVGDVKLV